MITKTDLETENELTRVQDLLLTKVELHVYLPNIYWAF